MRRAPAVVRVDDDVAHGAPPLNVRRVPGAAYAGAPRLLPYLKNGALEIPRIARIPEGAAYCPTAP